MTTAKDLSRSFRHVRLLLAREPGHPAGDREAGYDIVVPLDEQGRLDAVQWKAHHPDCHVRHFGGGQADRIGRLRRKAGGQWYFDFAEGERDDEVGFRFGEERFVTGEYVSVSSGGAMHTYQVAKVEKP